jgi:membrane protease YdiL (CAAX protease family)
MDKPPDRRADLFFAGVLLLSIPLWLLAAQDHRQLMPGLPLSALAAFCPAVAALTLTMALEGPLGALRLGARAFDLKAIASPAWLLLAAAFMPAVMALSFLVQRQLGAPIPNPAITPLPLVVSTLLFFAAAVGEELGWSGYALGPIQARFGALNAALILGVVWFAWHIIPFLQAGRSLDWIAWKGLSMLAVRLLMVWLYCNAGRSVLVVAVFHAMDNVAWQAFPVSGSFYDPKVTGLILTALAIGVVVATSPATLRLRGALVRAA